MQSKVQTTQNGNETGKLPQWVWLARLSPFRSLHAKHMNMASLVLVRGVCARVVAGTASPGAQCYCLRVIRRSFSPLAWYNRKLERSPLITKTITSGGDLVCVCAVCMELCSPHLVLLRVGGKGVCMHTYIHAHRPLFSFIRNISHDE